MQEPFPGLKRAFSPPGDPQNVVKEIDAELAFHFECTVRELRQRGLSRAEALEEASRRFGNLLEHRQRLSATRSRLPVRRNTQFGRLRPRTSSAIRLATRSIR